MGYKGIYDDWKSKRNVRKYSSYSHQIANQTVVADNISNEKKKESIVHNYNVNDIERGKSWFYDGLSLEDAPIDLKNNASFIAGFKKAEREQYVNDLAYQTGIEYYNKGIPFEKIPEMYLNNEFFMSGYNSKKTLTK